MRSATENNEAGIDVFTEYIYKFTATVPTISHCSASAKSNGDEKASKTK